MGFAGSSTCLQGTEIPDQVMINSPWYTLLILDTTIKLAVTKVVCHMFARALMEEVVQLL